MTKETVDGRAVFLRHTRFGWQVRWGRTVIGLYQTWKEAVAEIMALFG